MKVHAAIAQALADHGIDTMFGLMGDANMFVIDTFVRKHAGRFVSGASEAGVMGMANGYAAASGGVAVATVTLGPGLTNSITGLIEGAKGSLPVLLLAGDTPALDRDSIPNVDQREFVAASGAGFEQMRSAKTACEDLAAALRRTQVERRPVVLNMPLDLQWEDATYSRINIRVPDLRAVGAASADLDDAMAILAMAKRPILLAGRGAIDHECRSALIRLGIRTDAMLATTLKGKDLFRGEAGNLGIFGSLSDSKAADAIQKSDCIVAFGAGLNDYTTFGGAFLRGKRVVQVNRELSGIARYAQPDVGIVGDPALVADALIRGLDAVDAMPSGFRQECAPQTGDSETAREEKNVNVRPGTVDIRAALRRLNSAVPSKRVYVTDAGRFIGQAWVLIDATAPRHFIPAANYGAIGLGTAAAVGAALAVQDRVTLLVTGDGGFMLGGLGEFNTAVRSECDLVVVVCNDGSYGAEHMKFRARDMDPALSVFQWPDFAAVANALGGKGVTVRSRQDLEAAIEAIESRTCPLLIDLRLDPDAVPALPQ